MALPSILAYASIATLFVAIGVSTDTGWPIFHALAPIKSLRAFRWQLVVTAVVCSLAA